MEYTFTKSVDEKHQIKVESQLIYAIWKQGVARGGANIELEVRTSFVGEGAKIAIVIKGSKSKKIGSFNDLIFGNRYICAIPLPPDLELGEDVWFEVKMSGQKLKGKSNLIPAYPMPELISMSWNQQVARRGDILTLSAEFDRVEDDAKVTVHIYEFDSDGIHDPVVQIPTKLENKKLNLLWRYEYHEDTDEIPTQQELDKYGASYKSPEYFFVIDIDGSRFGDEQESGILDFRETYSAKIIDSFRMPIPDQKVIVELPDGSTKEMISDEKGFIHDPDLLPGKFFVKMINSSRSI